MNNYWQSDPPAPPRIPVARPQLPMTAELVPYLQRIDAARWYSNGGPLVNELEQRLALHCGDGETAVASVANATIGLTLALLACDLPAGSLCMVPAWTFAASAHAIVLAGLVPWIVDVDETSWSLTAEMARTFLRDAPGHVSAVMPVSPFGQPIDFTAWESFREETGVSVVVDAAAMFDCVRASSVPAVVSLHATKALGVGEGAFIISTDVRFREEVLKRANFGFWGTREATARSLNGKMSEYTAAVGLAALDRWQTIRADFIRVAQRYRAAFQNSSDVAMQEGFSDEWISATTIVALERGGAEQVGRQLLAQGIGTRRWWGAGLHRHAAFANCACGPTKNTDKLVERVIGLPCWRDLPNEKIDWISELVRSAVKQLRDE